MTNFNIARISTKLKEFYTGKIDMSDFPESKEHFLTRAIAAVTLMMKCGLNCDQSALHITDGYNDMGIDAIYLDEQQKQLVLIQSKWREAGTGGISESEINSFINGINRILEFDINGANNKILLKRNEIDYAINDINYQIKAIFTHTGNAKLNNYTMRPVQKILNSINDESNTILIFEELTYKDIYSYLATGNTALGINLDDVILNNWGKIDTPFPAYYGLLNAASIGVWYEKYGDSLCSKNLRFFKGATEVNDGIKRTLSQEPENFVYYNNGIKILCNKITRKAKDSTSNQTGLFVLEGASVVNGAQTVGAIGELFAENPAQVSKAQVMVHIIDLSSAISGMDTMITKLSNTQNRIESKDFIALDPEQERIRNELAFLHYMYLYKTGDKVNNFDNQLTIDEAIVALACANDGITYTVLSKSKVSALSEDISKPPYKILFNSSTNSTRMLNYVFIMREIEKNLQDKRNLLSGRSRLICIHGNRLIEHTILQILKKKEEIDKKVIFNEQMKKEISDYVELYLTKIISIINENYMDSYPANIFKNTTKNQEIYNILSQSI